MIVPTGKPWSRASETPCADAVQWRKLSAGQLCWTLDGPAISLQRRPAAPPAHWTTEARSQAVKEARDHLRETRDVDQKCIVPLD
jgi:hypothetical protein